MERNPNTELSVAATAPNIPSAALPSTMSAQPNFDAQIREIEPTPLPPQFDTTNLELGFYGSLEYITLPEHNNNGDTSIRQALCIHCGIKLISA